jgi:hypothetical protein
MSETVFIVQRDNFDGLYGFVDEEQAQAYAALFPGAESGRLAVLGRIAADTLIQGEIDGQEAEADEGTWTFFGHWEDDRIVVEYYVPGEVEDPRIDTGHWEQGLWAAAGSGATPHQAQVAVVAEYEAAAADEYEDPRAEH